MKPSKVALPIVFLSLSMIASECLVPEKAPAGGTEFPFSTETPTATEPHTSTPSATRPPTETPTPSDTPAPTLTPDLTATARSLACSADLLALRDCLDDILIASLYAAGNPEHRIVDSTDPSTVYRSEEILAILTEPGVNFLYNGYSRTGGCPPDETCLLQMLLIQFQSQAASQEFYDLATQATGQLQDERELPVPNAENWDDETCATGTRPSTQAGAPDFSVLYCSVMLDVLHFGFNLAAYGNLPADLVDEFMEAILEEAHDIMQEWLDNQ